MLEAGLHENGFAPRGALARMVVEPEVLVPPQP
jgi:hypothetical protein